jgi:hypothetical protein
MSRTNDETREALEAIYRALDRFGEGARDDVASVRREVGTLMDAARNAEATADAALVEVKAVRDMFSIQARENSEMVKFITANILALATKLTGVTHSEPAAAPAPALHFAGYFEDGREYPACALVRADGHVWLSKRQTMAPIPDEPEIQETSEWYLLA